MRPLSYLVQMTDAGSVPCSTTNQEGLDSLQALFLCANPHVARGSGRLPCGCRHARVRRNTPFPGQPSLFSLFALRVVAASNPVFTRAWRGHFVVNHAHRNTGYAHVITLVGTENDDDEDERDYQRRSVRVGLVDANDQGR